jgi:hypothetical protein
MLTMVIEIIDEKSKLEWMVDDNGIVTLFEVESI